jgi:hypothetical protein
MSKSADNFVGENRIPTGIKVERLAREEDNATKKT